MDNNLGTMFHFLKDDVSCLYNVWSAKVGAYSEKKARRSSISNITKYFNTDTTLTIARVAMLLLFCKSAIRAAASIQQLDLYKAFYAVRNGYFAHEAVFIITNCRETYKKVTTTEGTSQSKADESFESQADRSTLDEEPTSADEASPNKASDRKESEKPITSAKVSDIFSNTITLDFFKELGL